MENVSNVMQIAHQHQDVLLLELENVKQLVKMLILSIQSKKYVLITLNVLLQIVLLVHPLILVNVKFAKLVTLPMLLEFANNVQLIVKHAQQLQLQPVLNVWVDIIWI